MRTGFGLAVNLFIVAFSTSESRCVFIPIKGSRAASRTFALSQETQDLTRIRNHLNEHHEALLIRWLQHLTALGPEVSQANSWRGNALKILGAEASELTLQGLKLQAIVRETGLFGKETVRTALYDLPLPNSERVSQASDVQRDLISLAAQVNDLKATASLFALPIGDGRWVIPSRLRLNNVPHTRFARNFFYQKIRRSVAAAINDANASRQMSIRFLIPETNPSFDTFRIGTILELAREITFDQIDRGKRVKLCVQGKMGDGVFKGLPISLNGCRAVMEVRDISAWPCVSDPLPPSWALLTRQRMDWTNDPGEEHEGIIGTSLSFGEVGPDEVDDQDDVFLVIAPQNIVGYSIVPLLQGMVERAGHRPVVVINPNLKDRPSSNNVMQIRGREERDAFGASFLDVFVFETLHDKGLFRIVGAIGKSSHTEPWVKYTLEDNQDSIVSVNERTEVYKPVRVSEQALES